MCICWSCNIFGYYLIVFYMKYFQGDVYVNTAIGTFTEFFSYLISAIIMERFGSKNSMIIVYFLSAVSSFAFVFYEVMRSEKEICYYCGIFIFVTRFGISAACNIVQLVTLMVFPTEFLSTAFGIC